MRHAGTQELETDRLFLRRLLPEDAGMMYANWASDPQVTRFLRWEPHKNALETLGLLAANPASGRVMEKAGFVYHHDTVDHKFDGTPVECRCYLLTRERYNKID